MPNEAKVRTAARDVVRSMVGEQVPDDESLLASGRIDSLSILKLISQLEKTLNLRLPSDRLQPDDFETIDVIVETVMRTAG